MLVRRLRAPFALLALAATFAAFAAEDGTHAITIYSTAPPVHPSLFSLALVSPPRPPRPLR